MCSLLLLLACDKDTEPTNFAPHLTTGDVTDLYRKGATLSGNIRLTGNSSAQSYGILLSDLQSMAEYSEYSVTDTSQDFAIKVQNLVPGTTYYYCTYAYSGFSTAKGDVRSFVTPESNVPVFADLLLDEKDARSCSVSVSLLDDGGSEMVLAGFCWSKASDGDPTTEDNVQNVSINGTTMSTTITGLAPETEYLVRAYAVNTSGIGLSKSLKIKTDEAAVPYLSEMVVEDSTGMTITLAAQVLDIGYDQVTQIGFCWSADTEEPTITHSSNDLSEQLSEEKFVSAIDGLSPATTYYIRAYAKNSAGVGYSPAYAFTTDDRVPGIYTLEDLVAFRDAKNAGSDVTLWKNEEGIINLFADIDMSTVSEWTPISKLEEGEVFNGNSFTISGMNITQTTPAKYDDSNIYGNILGTGFIDECYGTITNLHLGEGNITLDSQDISLATEVGSVCSRLYGEVNNCSSKVTIKRTETVKTFCCFGGLIGNNLRGKVVGCLFEGEISCPDDDSNDCWVGGISGILNSTECVVESCTNNGMIEGDYAGGITNVYLHYDSEASIVNCTNTGKVVGHSSAGGISGKAGYIDNCVNEGNVTGSFTTGGICGAIGPFSDLYTSVGRIVGCTNKGDVVGGNVNFTGGILGLLYSQCYMEYGKNVCNGTVNDVAGSDANAIGDKLTSNIVEVE